MTRCLAVVIICVVGPAFAEARDIYVNNLGGDDQFSGHDEQSRAGDGPVRTINQALRRCAAADRIVIANTGVPYHESVSLVGGRNSGATGAMFVIEGNGATLDGRTTIPRQLWEGFDDVFRLRPPHQAYGVLYLGDRPAIFHPTLGVARRIPKMEPLEWTLADGYVWFRVERSKVIEDYPLSLSVIPVGISLYRVHDLIVANLTVQGFQLDGVNAHDGVRDCRLIDLTSRGNGRSGVTVANSSQVLVENCLMGDNLVAQLLTEGYSHTLVHDTLLLDRTAPAVVRDGGELVIDGKVQP